MFKGDFEQDANPRVQLVEDYWGRLWPILNGFNGTTARDFLQDLKAQDRFLFNAIYWRVEDWMATSLGRAALTEAEVQAGLSQQDVGPIRLTDFIRSRVPGDWWETTDLPRLFSDIKQGAAK